MLIFLLTAGERWYTLSMSSYTYTLIIRCFMVSMPVLLVFLIAFVRASARAGLCNNPAYQWALICIGILLGEIVRGALILLGIAPAHPKHITIWIAQLLPFGGLFYAILSRYVRRVLDVVSRDTDQGRR